MTYSQRVRAYDKGRIATLGVDMLLAFARGNSSDQRSNPGGARDKWLRAAAITELGNRLRLAAPRVVLDDGIVIQVAV